MRPVSTRAQFPLRGGPPAVDLVNTEVLQRGSPRDLLARADDLDAWLGLERDRLGLGPAPARAELGDAHALRAALRELFGAHVRGVRPPDSALDAVNAASARAPTHPELEWPAGGPPSARLHEAGEPGAADALAAVARSAIELLGGPDASRLRACGNARCVLFFVAENRRRAYCSEACGLRARVARHRRRRR
jgi:predicted RNA-binding Zn ribbon-like protein